MGNKKVSKRPKKAKVEPIKSSDSWPWLFKLSPKLLIWVMVAWIVLAWSLFLAVDIYQVIDFGFNRAMWTHLFNDKPVEWTQWFLLAFAITASGYLAARLDIDGKKLTAKFFFLFSIALGLMLIEEAGDIRHVISGEVHRLIDGDTIFGLPYRSMTDLPYFAALAAVPLYAVARYGRAVWDASIRARKYFITGFALYGVAAISSGARYLGDLYVRMGMWIDDNLFFSRFPSAHDHDQETTYLMIIDSPIEESIELFAVTMVLAAILAFAADYRRSKQANTAKTVSKPKKKPSTK